MSISTTATGRGVMTTLRQIAENLDSQRDQMVAAIERDYPVEFVPLAHDHKHRDLVDFFSRLANAREALVDAHNLLREVVDPIDMRRPR